MTSPNPGQAAAGVGPWVRCFTEEQRATRPPQSPQAERRWRLRTAASGQLGKIAARVFPDDPSAETVVAVLGGLTEPGACATLLDSAREAVDAGRLVLVATEHSVTGLGASLRAEEPALGVTVIKAAPTLAGLAAAKRFSAATPGVFREVVLDDPGGAVEPAMVPTIPGAAGTFPLGPADVVLVSGMTSLGDLACATALASRGAALAVLAPPGREDPRLAACLADLRAGGTRLSQKRAKLTDPAQVAVAVRSLERGLGPVTALVHAAVPGPTERCARLSESTLRGCLISQERRFSSVLAAVAPERLRVLLTFGSVAARYGAPAGACAGLAGGLLAEQARRWVAGLSRCRALHVDWAPWADPDAVGSDPGAAMAVSVADGSRMLITMLTTPDLPHRVAVHGRLGVAGAPAPLTSEAAPAAPDRGAAPAPPASGAALALRGRFLDTVRVHYPGVELVVDSLLSLQADPYLNDYRIDGLPVLPASMALEAMAQAASALTGAPRRHITGIRVAFPVVVATGEAVIRVCALHRGDAVETVLRCSETGFRVDHARAMFGDAPMADDSDGATKGGRGRHTRRQDRADMPGGGIVDGADLYGHIYFQAGRFRRIAFLPEVSSRGCRALVRGGDVKPWFGAVGGPVDVPMILGSAGLNDASAQVLQACLPHRRLLVASCESATFSGKETPGAVEVQAVRRPAAGSEGASTASGSWDVRAIDAAGQPLADWTGVTLRDLGPLTPTDGWHPTLLAAALEALAAELGIDATLRASISCGRQPLTVPRVRGGPSLPQPPSEGNPAGAAAPGNAEPSNAAGEGAARPGRWSDWAVGRGPLDGFELTVRGTRPVACRWQAVGSGRKDDPHDEELGRLRHQLRACLPDTPEAVETRLDTLAACLVALGREPGTPCVLEDARLGDWVVVRSSGVVAGCALTQISGVPATIAVCIAGRVTAPAQGNPAQGKAVSAQGPPPIRRNALLPPNCAWSSLRFSRLSGAMAEAGRPRADSPHNRSVFPPCRRQNRPRRQSDNFL
jgi:enediyne polyketide synthase